jgi:plastocyanin
MNFNNLEKEKKLLLAVGVVVIIAAGVAIFSSSNNGEKNQNQQTPEAVEKNPAPEAPKPIVIPQVKNQDQFRSEVPVNTKVPEMNEPLTAAQKEKIAVPNVVTAAAPGADTSFRSFEIRGEGGKFIPSEIIANQGDIVHISFSAVDKDYDIVFPSYSMSQRAKQGTKKNLEFQALSAGSFIYYCDSCGGVNSAATGKIIIVK